MPGRQTRTGRSWPGAGRAPEGERTPSAANVIVIADRLFADMALIDIAGK